MQSIIKSGKAYGFILLQFVLFITFLTLDISGGSIRVSSGIKFTLIVLCFCYVLTFRESGSKSFLSISQAALFFTVISDLFILLLNHYIYGVITFIIVQQLYGLRIDISRAGNNDEGRIPKLLPAVIRFLIQAAIALMVCSILRYLGISLESLLVVTVLYFISIVTNVVRALSVAYEFRHEGYDNAYRVLFAVGMLLFLLCDINVGLFNMTDFISLSQKQYQMIYDLSAILMWAFYAPAQVLIALSIQRGSKMNKEI